MDSVPRRADGRRIFSADFKQQQLARVERGEVTMAELARELGMIPGLVRRWKHLVQKGGQTAVAANEDVVPASALRAADSGSGSWSARWGRRRWRWRSCARRRRR